MFGTKHHAREPKGPHERITSHRVIPPVAVYRFQRMGERTDACNSTRPVRRGTRFRTARFPVGSSGSEPMSATTAAGDSTRMDVRAAAGVNDAMLAIGRILIAIIFVNSGIEKFMD